MYNLDLVDAAFRDAFPARSGGASLEYVKVEARDDSTLAIVMRVVRWDLDDETGEYSIRDIVEQELAFGVKSLDLATIGRLREYVAALVKMIEKVLHHPDLAYAHPAELVDFSAFKLAKAQTETDFTAALSVPSRYGKYLTTEPAQA